MDTLLVNRIAKLFSGLTSAHGIFIPESILCWQKGKGEMNHAGQKEMGKCSTVREPITPELWESHLTGKVGLGIAPITELNECSWCAVDIDNWSLDFKEMLQKISDLPFVMCRSKSGGAHLFLFFSKPVMCRDAREYLRNKVQILGLGNSEIFPKQDEIISKRGDIGNWLNMPYFGNSRKCVRLLDEEVIDLELVEFLDYAEYKQVTLDDLR